MMNRVKLRIMVEFHTSLQDEGSIEHKLPLRVWANGTLRVRVLQVSSIMPQARLIRSNPNLQPGVQPGRHAPRVLDNSSARDRFQLPLCRVSCYKQHHSLERNGTEDTERLALP